MSRVKTIIISVLIALIGAMSLSIASPHQARADVTAPSWWSGDCDVNHNPGSYALGASYNGVKACGPRPLFTTQADHLIHFTDGNGSAVGAGEYEWECVELVMRYMYQVYGIAPYVVTNSDAYNVVDDYGGSVLTKVVNNGGSVPTPGDILAFAASTNHPTYGHTAVVTADAVDASGNGTVTYMQQNASADGWGSVSVTNKVLGDGITGWLHNPNGSSGSVQVVDPNPDYNGDGFSDLAILHQTTDGGADLHLLFGSTSPLSNPGTWLRSLSGSASWSWSNMKAVTGDFNGNGYQDLAILHKRTDGGADIHVLYGGPGSSPLGNTTTITRSLPGPGWDWTKMKLIAGDYNGDHFSDLVVLHQTTDGGADVHIFFGGPTPFGNTTTWLRSLPAASSWNWSQMKLVSGDFNGNGYADLAIVHQRSDGGADVHVLYGGPGSSPLGNTTTITRSLPGPGWDWTKMKLTAGDYNGDHFSDLAILHQTSDGGADVHLLFGGTSPFGNTTTWLRSLTAASGWNWSQMKLESGDFNGNTYADLGIVHQRSDGGADVHVLYGGPGSSPLGNTTTITRSLPGPGWDWTKMLLAPAS